MAPPIVRRETLPSKSEPPAFAHVKLKSVGGKRIPLRTSNMLASTSNGSTKRNKPATKQCVNCGTSLSTKFCTQCGHNNSGEAPPPPKPNFQLKKARPPPKKIPEPETSSPPAFAQVKLKSTGVSLNSSAPNLRSKPTKDPKPPSTPPPPRSRIAPQPPSTPTPSQSRKPHPPSSPRPLSQPKISKLCPHCGSPKETKFCTQCGQAEVISSAPAVPTAPLPSPPISSHRPAPAPGSTAISGKPANPEAENPPTPAGPPADPPAGPPQEAVRRSWRKKYESLKRDRTNTLTRRTAETLRRERSYSYTDVSLDPRQRAILEVIETEEDYVRDLEIIMNVSGKELVLMIDLLKPDEERRNRNSTGNYNHLFE